ncbi:10790_t:CDS:2 [Ambispora gerdemannii]|uniref:10790_t:CDS:1 n=1 Tax=Ambispora gerdemannii TaxID=144530 RepID=A0A9N9FU38_9GLOM|nr:10790_t:CDS:2 [Ambispora gerdemannii]
MVDPTLFPYPPRARPRSPAEAQILYERIRNCALWLDAIPGLPVSVGFDAILGLIPSIGDVSGLILGMVHTSN